MLNIISTQKAKTPPPNKKTEDTIPTKKKQRI
jgi:hypothetical protein